MFTGLIQTQGTVIARHEGGDLTLTIAPDAQDFPLAMGASIACSGVCLTVVSHQSSVVSKEKPFLTTDDFRLTTQEGTAFVVTLSAETLRCTNPARWQVGARLNLEASLRVGDAIGGHFVSGHVDGLGRVVGKEPSGDSTVWTFEAPAALARFIAPKGSIAIDGVSLTVNQVRDQGSGVRGQGNEQVNLFARKEQKTTSLHADSITDSSLTPDPRPLIPHFTVNIIPHTAEVTQFHALKVGDPVHLEIDMLARYAARIMEVAA